MNSKDSETSLLLQSQSNNDNYHQHERENGNENDIAFGNENTSNDKTANVGTNINSMNNNNFSQSNDNIAFNSENDRDGNNDNTVRTEVLSVADNDGSQNVIEGRDRNKNDDTHGIERGQYGNSKKFDDAYDNFMKLIGVADKDDPNGKVNITALLNVPEGSTTREVQQVRDQVTTVLKGVGAAVNDESIQVNPRKVQILLQFNLNFHTHYHCENVDKKK